MHDAFGTSAAIGFPIAIAGSLGYVFNGLKVPGLPEFWRATLISRRRLGSWPLAFGRAFGVGLAHSLPVGKLKRVFALFLILMGTRMLISLF